MSYQVYACVTCERHAVFRGQASIGQTLTRISRKSANSHMVPRDGFDICQNDRIFFTVCYTCESLRRREYDLPAYASQGSGGWQHNKAANFSLARNLLNSWPLLSLLRRRGIAVAIDPGYSAPRPVIKIDVLTQVCNSLKDLEFAGVLRLEGQEHPKDNTTQRPFFYS